MERMRIDLADLLASGEEFPQRRVGQEPTVCRLVAVLDGPIGPGCPYPSSVSDREMYPFRPAELDELGSPVAARLALDTKGAAPFGRGDLVLLDRTEAVRRDPDEESYYALDLNGGSDIRLVRRAGRRLYVADPRSGDDPRRWHSLSLADRDLLDVIQGRVSLVIRRL